MPISRLDKLLEMLQIQPDDSFLLYAVGFEYEALEDFENAKKYYSTILDQSADYLPVYYQSGLMYATLGDKTKGIELLEKGIELAKIQNDKKTLRELNDALEELNDQ